MMKLDIQKFAVKKSTTFKESGIDIANNQSDLAITITFSDTQGLAWFSSATLNCTCNGVKKSASVSLSKGGKVSKTFTFSNITHNSDGKKSVSWSWSCATGTSNLGTVSASGTKALTTIARASKVYATNCNIGSFSTITINKYKDSFTTSLYYKSPTDSNYVAISGASKISGTSFAFEIPESWYNKIPNAKTMTCSIKAETYNGNSNIGSNTCSFTITAKEELCRPTITGSVVDTNDDVYALTNSRTRFVKYKSLPKVTWEASAKNGATLVSQKANGVDATSPYTYSEWKNVYVDITDSRGYFNRYWPDLDVVDYFIPTVQVSGGRTSPTSDSATISIYGSFFNGYFDANNTNLNNLSVSYKYREIGTTEWTNGATIEVTKENNSFKNENCVIPDLFDYQKSYEVQVIATDSLSTSLPYTFKVIKGIPIFDWCKDFLRVNELFIADKNAVLNDSTKTGTAYNTTLGGTQINGSFFLNGIDPFKTKILWQGGMYMNGDHTITLNEKVSDQKHGILLVWTNYEDGSAQNNGVNVQFIPKKYVELHPGVGHGTLLINGWNGDIGKKYVYVGNEKITGYSKNSRTVTENGIKWVNSAYVLRYVLGI